MDTHKRQIKTDNRPLYNQAIDALNQFIENGKYKPGDKLPKEEELAQHLGISRPTLREALGCLEGNGIIVRRHGVGTFVAAPARGTMRGGLERLNSLFSLASNAGVGAQRDLWEIQVVDCPAEVADCLNLVPGTPIVHTQMTAVQNNGCFAYLDSFLLAECVDLQSLKDFQNGSLLAYLVERGEPRISYTNSNIHSVTAGPVVSRIMRIDECKPLLLLEETFFTDTGQPVVWTQNYFVTDELNFHITRRIIRRH